MLNPYTSNVEQSGACCDAGGDGGGDGRFMVKDRQLSISQPISGGVGGSRSDGRKSGKKRLAGVMQSPPTGQPPQQVQG
jgi:hypothetical protein